MRSSPPDHPRVVLATRNPAKLAELRRVIAATGLQVAVLGLAEVADYPEPVETEPTFEGNALLKARACVAATGLPALADDSGLAVDVLNGMPGVRSARWAGPGAGDRANNELLLRQLADVPTERRRARFVCAMALVWPDGAEQVRRAELPGRLSEAPRGQNGFGYDPLFVPEGMDVTTAEMDPADKDAISHRGQAVRAIVAVLSQELERPHEPEEHERDGQGSR